MLPERVVAEWIEAFNARDVGAMLMHVGPEVEFHPPRMPSLQTSYRGHAGMTEWVERLTRDGPDYRFAVERVSCVDSDCVLAVGSLIVHGDHIAGLWGVHQISDGLIVSASHYMSAPELTDRLGPVASPPGHPRTP